MSLRRTSKQADLGPLDVDSLIAWCKSRIHTHSRQNLVSTIPHKLLLPLELTGRKANNSIFTLCNSWQYSIFFIDYCVRRWWGYLSINVFKRELACLNRFFEVKTPLKDGREATLKGISVRGVRCWSRFLCHLLRAGHSDYLVWMRISVFKWFPAKPYKGLEICCTCMRFYIGGSSPHCFTILVCTEWKKANSVQKIRKISNVLFSRIYILYSRTQRIAYPTPGITPLCGWHPPRSLGHPVEQFLTRDGSRLRKRVCRIQHGNYQSMPHWLRRSHTQE